jgi:hypothetical protein
VGADRPGNRQKIGSSNSKHCDNERTDGQAIFVSMARSQTRKVTQLEPLLAEMVAALGMSRPLLIFSERRLL